MTESRSQKRQANKEIGMANEMASAASVIMGASASIGEAGRLDPLWWASKSLSHKYSEICSWFGENLKSRIYVYVTKELEVLLYHRELAKCRWLPQSEIDEVCHRVDASKGDRDD